MTWPTTQARKVLRQVREDVAGKPPPGRRHEGDDAVDVDPRVAGEVDRHDEHAHALDQEFDPEPEVGDGCPPEEAEDAVQGRRENAGLPAGGDVPPEHRHASHQAIDGSGRGR